MKIDVSIVVEWENVLLAQNIRCLKMLSELGVQMHESPFTTELIVLFNPGQVSREAVEKDVAACLKVAHAESGSNSLRIEAGSGLHYYQLKNYGAQIAQGEVIVFMDTDVIPERGWLEGIATPLLESDEIDVLAGHTYLDPEDVVSRAFALGWFFPLRTQSAELISGVPFFFANNVAFRREFFLEHPFPEMPDGMTRGACTLLSGALRKKNVKIWKNHAAQATHPAPNGLKHFIYRGLAEGRDWAMRRKMRGKGGLSTNAHMLKKTLRNMLEMTKKSARNGRDVGLPYWQLPIAVGIMWIYFIEMCLGAWLFSLFPRLTSKSWHV